MKPISYFFISFAFLACQKPVPIQPPGAIIINAFFENSKGEDLLNQQLPNAYKQNDLYTINVISVNGQKREDKSPNLLPIQTDYTYRYVQLVLPSSYAKIPLATYVHLSPSVMDTITYHFSVNPKIQYVPDQILYNKKVVWDISNVVLGQGWPPMTIIK